MLKNKKSPNNTCIQIGRQRGKTQYKKRKPAKPELLIRPHYIHLTNSEIPNSFAIPLSNSSAKRFLIYLS
ncbi:hypothetical protein CKAN_02175600 [Cinnamomum micranthum f. kanehirae]|uniref:Uncharacterized protein n=1 Tax=Cinnamomum micranthum f. kanehirae TaxID=337451 RepID=A0A443PP36_9MAGN|nr:hypothetical protein CKAN_02175600 [Cinnamomum micranthum f. kanehirae]